MSEIDLSRVEYKVIAVLSTGELLQLDEVAENIAWEENEKELATRLNLTLRDVPFQDGRLSDKLALCTVVYLYADWGEEMQEIFQGKVWEWSHSRIDDDPIVLTCYDLLFYLQKSTSSKYYAKGKKTKAIIEDILKSWKVPLGEYTGPNVAHKKILYKNKTISAMIFDTLDKAKKLDGGKGILRAAYGKAEVITYGGNDTVYGFNAEVNIYSASDKFSMTELVTRVIITGKDDKKGRPKVKATLNGKTEYGILQAVQSKGTGSLKAAKKEAKNLLKEKGKPKRTITIEAPDFPLIRKGTKVFLELDREKGYFIVKGISHNATQMKMQMEVEPEDE